MVRHGAGFSEQSQHTGNGALSPLCTAWLHRSKLEYKYLVMNNDGRVSMWKPGDNVCLETPKVPGAFVRIADTWDGEHQVLIEPNGFTSSEPSTAGSAAGVGPWQQCAKCKGALPIRPSRVAPTRAADARHGLVMLAVCVLYIDIVRLALGGLLACRRRQGAHAPGSRHVGLRTARKAIQVQIFQIPICSNHGRRRRPVMMEAGVQLMG